MEIPRTVFFLLSAILAIFLHCTSVLAQVDIQISRAVAFQTAGHPDHWQITVGFSDSFDLPADLQDVENPSRNPIKDPRNFYLIDVDTGQRISVLYVYFDAAPHYTAARKLNPAAGLPDAVTIYVDSSVRLTPKHHYHLYVLNVVFRGQPTKDPQPQRFIEFAEAQVTASAAPTTTSLPEKGDPAIRDSLSFTAADGREDANIYLSGEYSGASGTKFNGSVDLKIEIPFRKIVRNRIHSFSPFFDLKASSDPKADPDSMSLGLNWEWPIWRYRGDNLRVPIRRTIWRNAPKIESDRSFDNTNFIWESRLRFMSRTYASKRLTFYFRPFIGQELGANITSPVQQATGRFLYRPIVGTTLNVVFPIQTPGLHDISLEGSYIRRWPLRPEVSFEEDDDGNLKALSIGKSPRDYVTAKASFGFTKAFGLSIGYEYGELPPNFKLVDHKATIGLTYKIKIDR